MDGYDRYGVEDKVSAIDIDEHTYIHALNTYIHTSYLISLSLYGTKLTCTCCHLPLEKKEPRVYGNAPSAAGLIYIIIIMEKKKKKKKKKQKKKKKK